MPCRQKKNSNPLVDSSLTVRFPITNDLPTLVVRSQSVEAQLCLVVSPTNQLDQNTVPNMEMYRNPLRRRVRSLCACSKN